MDGLYDVLFTHELIYHVLCNYTDLKYKPSMKWKGMDSIWDMDPYYCMYVLNVYDIEKNMESCNCFYLSCYWAEMPYCYL